MDDRFKSEQADQIFSVIPEAIWLESIRRSYGLDGGGFEQLLEELSRRKVAPETILAATEHLIDKQLAVRFFARNGKHALLLTELGALRLERILPEPPHAATRPPGDLAKFIAGKRCCWWCDKADPDLGQYGLCFRCRYSLEAHRTLEQYLADRRAHVFGRTPANCKSTGEKPVSRAAGVHLHVRVERRATWLRSLCWIGWHWIRWTMPRRLGGESHGKCCRCGRRFVRGA